VQQLSLLALGVISGAGFSSKKPSGCREKPLVMTGASVAGAALEGLGLVSALPPDQARMRAAALGCGGGDGRGGTALAARC
jgi:enoyl-CoA hydratase/carnithine racemase